MYEIHAGDMTPWGEAMEPARIADGVYEVQTPSHGGIMIDAHSYFAKNGLSDAAWDVADHFHNWLVFEEDTAFAVAMYDIIYNDCGLDWSHEYYEMDPDRYEEIITKMIQLYYPEYARYRGIAIP